uniref:ras-like protein family member 11A n=1 Tax=Myxine glutinosa TaxID=7769 RepID=UPI00358FAF85
MRLTHGMAGSIGPGGGGASALLAPIPEQLTHALDGGGSVLGPSRTLKVAVLGSDGVGKTALVVRFLTKRFIGDYESNTGSLYSRHILVDGEQLLLQMQDTPGLQAVSEDGCSPDAVAACLQWADAFVLVFAVTSQASFSLVSSLLQLVRRVLPTSWPVAILGNKTDLLHSRQVASADGHQLANEHACLFYREASAAESCANVLEAFQDLLREAWHSRGGGGGGGGVGGGGSGGGAGSSGIGSNGGERRKASLVIPRPRSPNMQDLKRRFRQALTAKGKTGTS